MPRNPHHWRMTMIDRDEKFARIILRAMMGKDYGRMPFAEWLEKSNKDAKEKSERRAKEERESREKAAAAYLEECPESAKTVRRPSWREIARFVSEHPDYFDLRGQEMKMKMIMKLNAKGGK